jgi:hypothetical protein
MNFFYCPLTIIKALSSGTVSDRVFTLKISLISREINSTGTDVFNPEVTSSVKVGAEFVPYNQHFYFSTLKRT